MDKLREGIKTMWREKEDDLMGADTEVWLDRKISRTLSLILQHRIDEHIEEAEYVCRLIDRGWIPPEEARMMKLSNKSKS